MTKVNGPFVLHRAGRLLYLTDNPSDAAEKLRRLREITEIDSRGMIGWQRRSDLRYGIGTKVETEENISMNAIKTFGRVNRCCAKRWDGKSFQCACGELGFYHAANPEEDVDYR